MRIKRAIASLVIGGAIFGGVYALAASLGVSSSTLGAGNAVVVACQAGTVNVGYTPSYGSASPAGYRATTVTIGNLDTSTSACGGKDFKVTLTGPSGSDASLGEQTGTTPTTGTSANLTFSGVNASDVTGVHVTITG